ncbi:MAG: carbohydrate ABC transporter permease [Chloroflexota bacterium]
MAAATATQQPARRIKWSTVAHYALLIILALIILFPGYMMILTSLKRQVMIMSKEPLWFFTPTLANYEKIIEQENFLRHLISSIYVGLATTIITLYISSWAAYAISRMRFPGRGLMANTTLLVRMVPPAVLTVPIFALWGRWENIWYQQSAEGPSWHSRYLEWIGGTTLCTADGDLMDALCNIFSDGLLDGRLGLILFYSALNLPFIVWLLVGFINQIPIDLEEAAIVDGATPFQVFRRIISPLLAGGYAVAAIFTFRIAWNEFILALILTGRRTYTLPVKTSLFTSEEGVLWGLIMAMGTLIVLPPLLLTFFAARQIISGMTAGAVKG